MKDANDPWSISLRRLSAGPPLWIVPDGILSVRWEPQGTSNPRRRDGMNFAETEAVAFVRRHLERALRGVRDPRVHRRLERLNQAPEFVALVLEIGGEHGHPVVYVKWVLSPPGKPPAVWFLSFHPSMRIPR